MTPIRTRTKRTSKTTSKTTSTPTALLTGLIATVVVAAACASSPPERLYTLSSGVRAATSSTRLRGPSVVVAPAALPQLVDRPQLVLRADDNQVAILEQQRWAEPLRSGISRVIAEDLGRLLDGWRVSNRDEAIGVPDCRVTIDVRRFDTARADGAARVQALWIVACAGSGERTGQTAAEERVSRTGAGADLDGAVAAHGRALAIVSRDIAHALRELAPEVPGGSATGPLTARAP